MSAYKLTSSESILDTETGDEFLQVVGNKEYDKYLTWREEGNTPEPADPIPNPRIAEIKQQLDTLDFKKIRPLAAGDTEYLALLQAQTVVMQDELRSLM